MGVKGVGLGSAGGCPGTHCCAAMDLELMRLQLRNRRKEAQVSSANMTDMGLAPAVES